MQRSGPVEGSPAEAAVFTTVLTAGAISRADIARRTGLSSAAITRAAQPLLDAGYLRYAEDELAPGGEAHDDATRMGRPSRPLAVTADRTGAIGVKLMEHEAIGVVCDLSGAVRARAARQLPDTSVDTALSAIAELVAELRVAAETAGFPEPVRHVGLSVAGDVDHTTGDVRYSPFLGWRGVPLGSLAAARTRCPVVVENDVKALTVAEQWFGLARGLEDFALVTIGAGIGCALVVDGTLVRGAHSVAGEIGHLPVGDPAVRCHCGGRGCVEAEASTAALLHRCRVVAEEPDLTLDEATQRARGGDRPLAEVFAAGGRLIGRAIASVANLLGPDQVIVSGEGLASWDLLGDAIRETFAEQAFGAADRTTVHLRPLPFDEWARGAAAVAIEELVFPSREPGSRRTFGNGDV